FFGQSFGEFAVYFLEFVLNHFQFHLSFSNASMKEENSATPSVGSGGLSYAYIQHPSLRCNIPESRGLFYDDANTLLISTTANQVFSWQTSPFNADVSPSVDSISERPILFIKFYVNKKAIAVQRSECEIQIFIEKPSRYLPTNAGQDQRAFSDSFGVTLHYVTLQL
ncbi:unnamed protein product, partial [Brassica oleracea]